MEKKKEQVYLLTKHTLVHIEELMKINNNKINLSSWKIILKFQFKIENDIFYIELDSKEDKSITCKIIDDHNNILTLPNDSQDKTKLNLISCEKEGTSFSDVFIQMKPIILKIFWLNKSPRIKESKSVQKQQERSLIEEEPKTIVLDILPETEEINIIEVIFNKLLKELELFINKSEENKSHYDKNDCKKVIEIFKECVPIADYIKSLKSDLKREFDKKTFKNDKEKINELNNILNRFNWLEFSTTPILNDWKSNIEIAINWLESIKQWSNINESTIKERLEFKENSLKKYKQELESLLIDYNSLFQSPPQIDLPTEEEMFEKLKSQDPQYKLTWKINNTSLNDIKKTILLTYEKNLEYKEIFKKRNNLELLIKQYESDIENTKNELKKLKEEKSILSDFFLWNGKNIKTMFDVRHLTEFENELLKLRKKEEDDKEMMKETMKNSKVYELLESFSEKRKNDLYYQSIKEKFINDKNFMSYKEILLAPNKTKSKYPPAIKDWLIIFYFFNTIDENKKFSIENNLTKESFSEEYLNLNLFKSFLESLEFKISNNVYSIPTNSLMECLNDKSLTLKQMLYKLSWIV